MLLDQQWKGNGRLLSVSRLFVTRKNYCSGTGCLVVLLSDSSFSVQQVPSGIESTGARAVVLDFFSSTRHLGERMPIGGIVITVRPDDRLDVEVALTRFSGLSVYGSDEKGNIIAVINGDSLGSIEAVIKTIEEIDTVLKVNLAYLNTDDAPNALSGDG